MYLRAMLCAALCVVLPASAMFASERDPVATQQVESGTPNSDMPPLRFQGDNAVVVVFTDRQGIDGNCGKAQPGYVILACHRQHKESGASIIFMPNPCLTGGLEFYAKLSCHELAHANGWTADHEL